MAQDVLATLAGTTPATISRLETGEMGGSAPMLVRVSDATRRVDRTDWVRVDEIVRWVPPPKADETPAPAAATA